MCSSSSEVKTGHVIGELHQRHRARELRGFLDTIEATVPAELDVHLAFDPYSTQKTDLIRRWFLTRPHFHLHFTPTGASRLNLVERWFARFTERQLRLGMRPSVRALKTADKILANVVQFSERTSETGRPLSLLSSFNEGKTTITGSFQAFRKYSANRNES